MIVVDVTPQWRPNLPPVTGMAAHQSMRRLTTPAIHARLSILRVYRAEQAGLPTEAQERALRLASLDRQIAACVLALGWREGEQP